MLKNFNIMIIKISRLLRQDYASQQQGVPPAAAEGTVMPSPPPQPLPWPEGPSWVSSKSSVGPACGARWRKGRLGGLSLGCQSGRESDKEAPAACSAFASALRSGSSHFSGTPTPRVVQAPPPPRPGPDRRTRPPG